MNFKFCPNCAKIIEQGDLGKYKRFWKCDCGFELFNNIASAVGVVIKTPDGKILFERRAKEPRKGFLAFPGGFVDPNESLEEAAARECMEEIGVKPKTLRYIASFPNTYTYNEIEYKTCDTFFEATIEESVEFKPQESEVLSLKPHFVRNMEELKKLPLAFNSAFETLKIVMKEGV